MAAGAEAGAGKSTVIEAEAAGVVVEAEAEAEAAGKGRFAVVLGFLESSVVESAVFPEACLSAAQLRKMEGVRVASCWETIQGGRG